MNKTVTLYMGPVASHTPARSFQKPIWKQTHQLRKQSKGRATGRLVGGRWACPFGRLGDPSRETLGPVLWVWISADLGGRDFLGGSFFNGSLQHLRVSHHDWQLFPLHFKTFKICQHHFSLGKPKLSDWLLYKVHFYNTAPVWKVGLGVLPPILPTKHCGCLANGRGQEKEL